MKKKGVVVNILGRRGSGKSTKTQTAVLLREYGLPDPARVVVVDTLLEYDFETFPGEIVTDIYEFFDVLKNKPSWSVLVLQFEDMEKYFDSVCRAVNYLGRIHFEEKEKIIFVVEEVDAYTKPGWSPPAFKRMIKYGRHWGVSIVSNSRRPAEFPKLLTSQSDVIVSFVMNDEADIRYIKSFCKDGERDIRDVLKNLGEYEYMKYDANSGKMETFKD